MTHIHLCYNEIILLENVICFSNRLNFYSLVSMVTKVETFLVITFCAFENQKVCYQCNTDIVLKYICFKEIFLV